MNIRFIIEEDHIQELQMEGSVLDLVAMSTFLVNSAYKTLATADKPVAAMYQSMIMTAIKDPASPVWETKIKEGETCIGILKPQKADGKEKSNEAGGL